MTISDYEYVLDYDYVNRVVLRYTATRQPRVALRTAGTWAARAATHPQLCSEIQSGRFP